MNKNEKILFLIEEKDLAGLKQMYINEEMDISEYNNAVKLAEEVYIPDYSLTPEEYKYQYAKSRRYYTALIIFGLIDIVPFMWLVLFFIYWPVVIYTWIVAFGSPLLLPTDGIIEEHRQLNKFIILSWIPLIGIGADIAIVVKASSLKRQLNDDQRRYQEGYKQNLLAH